MSSYHDEFRKGEEAAKIRSRKQALVTVLLQGTVIAIAIFNEFPILIKVLIFIVLQLILGIIMSSKRVQSTWVPQPQKNNQSLSSAQQLTPKLARKEPGSYDEKVAANSIREFLVQKKNQSEVEEVRGSNTDKILEEFKQELTKVKANLPHK